MAIALETQNADLSSVEIAKSRERVNPLAMPGLIEAALRGTITRELTKLFDKINAIPDKDSILQDIHRTAIHGLVDTNRLVGFLASLDMEHPTLALSSHPINQIPVNQVESFQDRSYLYFSDDKVELEAEELLPGHEIPPLDDFEHQADKVVSKTLDLSQEEDQVRLVEILGDTIENTLGQCDQVISSYIPIYLMKVSQLEEGEALRKLSATVHEQISNVVVTAQYYSPETEVPLVTLASGRKVLDTSTRANKTLGQLAIENDRAARDRAAREKAA